MNQIPSKRRFLIRQFAEFSISCAKPGYYDDNPIFDFESKEFDLEVTKKMKNDIRNFLLEYYADLAGNHVSEEDHKKRLRSLSTVISRRYKCILYERRYRLGIAQKVVNTFLKLLWSADLINTPHHCPFDNKVKRKIEKFSEEGYLCCWTDFTSMKEYENYVSAARIAAAKEVLSIADWDLTHFINVCI